MVYIPVRKCWHLVKICFLFVLVLCLLTLFEKWRGGKRSAVALEAVYEKQIQEDEARLIPGLGEGGEAAILKGEIEIKKGEESEKKNAMNVYLSDRIPYNRTLKDFRNPSCRRVVYDAELPSASVILIFHNEPYSAVLRTIWTVLNSVRRSTPFYYSKTNYIDHATGAKMTVGYKGQPYNSKFVYLKEIILVDDCSTLPELKGKLSYYIKTRLPPDMIRLVRLPKRKGLTRARIAGSRIATSEVMVFLDAHCEPNTDWMRPLLQRIKEKRDAVINPVIDELQNDNFAYYTGDFAGFYDLQVGGFTFNGHFTWMDVPEREKKRRGSEISPTWSPTMAGGLFAINRAYYWELGGYDEMMAGWGGENLEMSFRTWQCGGTLETIPCSRVGHVFRSFHPYGLPGSSDTHGINTARMADVWMDEYAELFYLYRPDLRNSPKIGDITHRKILREKLHCKSFQWYLENIYPEKFVPVRDTYAYGRFKNKYYKTCLDTLQRTNTFNLGVYPCHSQLTSSQFFSISIAGQLRLEDKCASVGFAGNAIEGRPVKMESCMDATKFYSEQVWTFANGVIKHVGSKLCLTAVEREAADVVASICTGGPEQLWAVDFNQDNDFERSSDYPVDGVSVERDERLKKLRIHRRISRSLLSLEERPAPPARPAGTNSTHRRSRRKKHRKRSHKRRNKNKFILRLERTVPPASGQGKPNTEHLEVDIRCPHRRLYPNDTFVKDLVSVLNMHDITVINNGRIFEKHRVSQLPRAEKKVKSVVMAPMGDLRQHVVQSVPSHPETHQEKHPHSRQRKLRRPPVTPTALPPQEPPPLPAPPMLPPAMTNNPPRSDQHKIIVEDFVEMATTEVNAKKRYHMRKRNKQSKPQRAPSPPAPSPTAPPVPQSARDALLALLGEKIDKATRGESKEARHEDPLPAPDSNNWPEAQSSSEDVPLILAPSSVETWNTGAGQAVIRNDSMRRDIQLPSSDELEHPDHGQQQTARADGSREVTSQELENEVKQLHSDKVIHQRVSSDDDEQKSGERGRARAKPVKVTMRNNFTFNIGDEFFSWRANNDDVADILGELALPSNSSPSSPPIEAWVKPARPRLLRARLHGTSDSSSEDVNQKIITGHGLSDDDSTSASRSESSGDN